MFDKVKYDVVLDDGVQPYRYLMVVDRYGVFFFKVEILVIVLCDLLIQRHDHTHFMTFFHQFRRKGTDDIGQTAGLDERQSLTGNHQNACHQIRSPLLI